MDACYCWRTRPRRAARKERDAKKAKAKEAKERKKLGVLGRRQGSARELGLWGFDQSQAKSVLVHALLPLHHLWMGYMSELLNLPQPSSGPPRPPSGAAMHPKLLKADFHGSIMTVHQTKNISILGISGIVIHETERTFKVVTKENKLKVLPKHNSIFTSPADVLDSPHIRFELHGNQFCFRSADRAGRKFKAKETIEL
ncbi:Rof/RNase P-like protein [Mycena sp. CBHHK59/15]|nr:Rof/RNase P-like protein [Mycena sp. CBHHK59/15]